MKGPIMEFEWKPIEEAPVEFDNYNTLYNCLLWSKDTGIVKGYVFCRENGQKIGSASGYLGFSYTKFYPLPDAPKE